MSRIPNDEPVYEGYLDHFGLVKQVANLILDCDPPYVLGVCGSWGSGKTSFLRKLWAFFGGPFDVKGWESATEALRQQQRLEWFGRDYQKPSPPQPENGWHLIWFNPWQHQFEETPLVALLQEVRQHFTLIHKVIDEGGKLLDVTVHATLNMLSKCAKELKVPIPSAKGILERGREYEAEHFSTPLTSQRFRDFFEKAIEQVIGPKGRMVIFIDDLDRCEGTVAYRLLESLKLYLNARNCIYVLWLDQAHLEESIARVLSGSEETRFYRPLARDYLSKMFQSLFLLPVPASTEVFVERILNPEDEAFKTLLEDRFGLPANQWSRLVVTLNANLPHNPRKLKSFISSWKLYLGLLADQQPADTKLNWRLAMVLHYLAQFEEPVFRKVEEAPGFYSDHLVRFCREGSSNHPLLTDFELPYRAAESIERATGGLESGVSSASQTAAPSETGKPLPPPPGMSFRIGRIFWISRLVNDLASERLVVSEAVLRQHLMRTGGPLPLIAQE